LGDAGTGYVFTNSGVIAISGDTAIDMGAQNAFAFTNSGIIDFRDGAPDDILTITGDFAGSGALGVDVSGLNGSGDHLYINGNVVADSVTTINANILDVPTAAYGSVGVVSVTGDSTAGSFVLGDVTFDTTQSFLTVDVVSLQSAIDTSNAVADVFSVDFAVTGLTDAGTLAAGFSPGVQSLMNSQVGTWRQRMGVIDKAAHGLSIWGRAFADNGTVYPKHVAGNFGQGGDFSFDQRNSGQEVGVDYGFSDQFIVGLLVGKAHATQRLSSGDTGSTKLDGNTSGVYGTWISPSGFYLDLSYRHMSFDAKLNSIAGETRTHGTANAFNLEAGYAWTLGNGFKIEPQLQYTRTTVGDVDTLSGALTGFTPDGGASSRGRLGVAVRKSFEAGGRVWTPYGAISAVREFDGENAYSINGNFFGTTSTQGTSALVEGGLNVQTGNLSVFGGVSWQDGGALDSVVGGQVGVRYSW
jgi:outer membrane autotransporter protein